MRIVLLSLCVIGLTGLAENPRVDLAPSAEGRCRRLFNGKDLSGWYTFLKGRGKNVDPKGVFSVRDGVIHVTGEEWGCLTSEEEFSNYRLSLEYRFTGARQFGGKAEKAPDSGLLFHSTGPDGGFCGIWMESLELNIIKGATGDFWGVGMKGSDRIALSATVGKDLVEGKYAVHDPQGTETYTIKGNTRVCRSDIARNWGDRKTVAVAANEKPLGEWNRVVLTCVGDTVVAEVNGKVVNRGFAAKPQKGRIQLQSEGCEVEFRNIALCSLVPPVLRVATDRAAPSAEIVLPDAPTPVERTAAAELCDGILKMTGRAPAVVGERAATASVRFFVGATRAASAAFPAVRWKPDEIAVASVPSGVVLTGEATRGPIYAVDAYLEEICGVRWWTADASTYPKLAALPVKELALRHVPPFRYRETYYLGAMDPIFKVRLKGNFTSRTKYQLEQPARIPAAWGGDATMHFFEKRASSYHTVMQILPPERHFAAHPEWYALEKGARAPHQLCLTNPEMRTAFVAALDEILMAHPETDFIQISQEDRTVRCACDGCRAVEAAEGAVSGLYLRFVNAVAEALEPKHPRVTFDTFAYRFTRKPPKLTRPRHNVSVRLCDIECAFNAPLEDFAGNRDFLADLEGWARLAPGRLYIWDYATNFSGCMLPHPNLEACAANVRLFAAHGALGVFEQGDSVCRAGCLAPFRAWTLAHLLWNPQADERKLRDEFLSGYYGPSAAPHLAAYLDLIDRGGREAAARGVAVPCYHANVTSFWTKAEALAACAAVDAACVAARGDGAAYAQRVEQERLSTDLVRLLNWRAWRLGGEEERQMLFRAWHAACRARGVKAYREAFGAADFEACAEAVGRGLTPDASTGVVPKPKAPGKPGFVWPKPFESRNLPAAAGAGSGEEHVGFTVVTTRTRGKPERTRLTVPVKDGAALFRWPRAAIPSDATCVEVIPDFATATKGEEGYFVMPDGGGCYGTFRADSGRLALSKNWFPITAFGMKTPRRTFVAMPTGLRWNFNPVVDVKGGVYTMSCRFDMDVATAYEDPAITFRFLTGEDANYSGMGRAVRAKRLADGEMKPLKERAKTNPTLAWAVGTPIVRIRHCWKDFRKVALPEQNLVDEPPVDVYCTFDRAKELARALRAAGVAKADLCLVGWNYRGHDGRYPQVFPVEPLLGGEAKLRELIRCVREELGWQIVGHMNYRDAYLISDLFDFEYCQDRLPDGTRDARHLEPWSGGAVYRICPQRAYERFALRHTAMMKSLGFSGLGYLDVTTSRPLFPCRDARHPLNNAERRVWENAIFDLQTRAFGGCSSEGGYDFALGHYDSALTISFAPAFNEPKKPGGKLPWHPLVDGRVPFWQIAYHGVVMSAPFRTVWNAVKNPDRRQLLKSIEYGGRPVFYVYGGWNLPDRAHWDIRCRTDAELADCVQTIKAGTDEYNRRAALEWEYMDDHRELQPGVFRVTYSNGARVYVNYNATPVAVDGLTLPAQDALIRPARPSGCWNLPNF